MCLLTEHKLNEFGTQKMLNKYMLDRRIMNENANKPISHLLLVLISQHKRASTEITPVMVLLSASYKSAFMCIYFPITANVKYIISICYRSNLGLKGSK